MPPQIIGLLTDFGCRDPFVGMMKGVMAGINPALQFIDISHEITPQDIRQAALVLAVSYAYFPPGSIFVAVVDPGVGGSRRPIVAQTADYTFVGPDNGVLGPALAAGGVRRVIHVTHEEYCRRPVSRTFHGRDVFAPVAAWLSRGVDAAAMGPIIEDYVRLSLPAPQALGEDVLAGEVIYQDRFGNLITNLSETWVAQHWGPPPWVNVVAQVEKAVIHGVDSYYAQRAPEALGLIVNSWGLLEIFANHAHAAQLTGAAVGSPVRLRRATA
jgi:S-adenosylmethionine hydrolase